ncbi:hypothetical protein HDV01_001378 [Terramyces sp. JEL0728]|nr:hypothetical protein HDV01_001378 [Terramyces sp. JEL0728]
MHLAGYINSNSFFYPKWSAIQLPHKKSTTQKTLSIVTFNIWFDGLLQQERYAALINEISKHSPDVICLQECNSGSQKQLSEHPYIKQNYILTDINMESFDTWYGIVMLIKKELTINSIEKIPFQTRMGRYLIKTNISVNGRDISIGTSHFESGFNDFEMRKQQWQDSTTNLQGTSILCGDFNIHDDENETEILASLGWKDTWFDGEKKSKDVDRGGITFGHWKGGKERRLDRVLYKGLKPTFIEIIGDYVLEGFPAPIYISDHMGVYTTFQV